MFNQHSIFALGCTVVKKQPSFFDKGLVVVDQALEALAVGVVALLAVWGMAIALDFSTMSELAQLVESVVGSANVGAALVVGVLYRICRLFWK